MPSLPKEILILFDDNNSIPSPIEFDNTSCFNISKLLVSDFV